MFLFTGPTPKLLNSCGANVVDLMAVRTPHTQTYSLRLRPRSHVNRPPPAFDLNTKYSFPIHQNLGLRPHSPVLFLGSIPKSAIFGLSALDLIFLSHTHKISQLTNSSKTVFVF